MTHIMPLSITTASTMTHNITAIIMPLSLTIMPQHNNSKPKATQHNNIEYNATQHNNCDHNDTQYNQI
jgi:hypothetical protein